MVMGRLLFTMVDNPPYASIHEVFAHHVHIQGEGGLLLVLLFKASVKFDFWLTLHTEHGKTQPHLFLILTDPFAICYLALN